MVILPYLASRRCLDPDVLNTGKYYYIVSGHDRIPILGVVNRW